MLTARLTTPSRYHSRYGIDVPPTDERYGCREAWLSEAKCGSIFTWTEDELDLAEFCYDGYLGRVCGIDCYVRNAEPISAS